MPSKFKIQSRYKPIADQQNAIDKLSKNVLDGQNYQVLLGVTGSGKTFTMANVIQKLQRPALVISHNKTLAAQLYQELRDFFPQNSVSYFVSYYDYYQPEAYIPSTDTYIEKDSQVNDLIDKLRLAATTNLLTRPDTIVVASVSCIYNIGSPIEYGNFVLELKQDIKLSRDEIIDRLLSRVELSGNLISKVTLIDPVSGSLITNNQPLITNFILYPAKHFMTDPVKNKDVFKQIEDDLTLRVEELKYQDKELEAHRLKQKVSYDIEQIKEFGFVKGIENYSRYFDGRSPGDAPYSLLEYYNQTYGKDWLVFVDESHITLPQIRGMHAGDQSRKQTLIDYGFRLPSASDNRPLRFDEFMRKIPGFVALSATPAEYELSLSKNNVVEQLVRPTGIPDPIVEIRPIDTQVADVMQEIKLRAEKHQRTLVTTLTKRTAEDLSEYLKEKGLKVAYLHSDIETLDRTDLLDNLRRGEYDCLIGINLLREGLDLPEVSLVAILDADKEGFLRSDVSLIQTMGRAARHIEGKVILYADRETGSMKRALEEVRRRREYQLAMNKKYGITPTPIEKPFREKLIEKPEEEVVAWSHIDTDSMTPMDKKKLIKDLKREMRLAAEDLNFELAAQIRDKVRELEE
ncbi:MAG: UvrABC system protein B [Candidatus Woesebacteria bacterium GW2011_GWB1_38_5b]|uniref:UvrABC system protein B n=1 Tax=Candidatus Woesebacteria bacterium GW2011_GWB1_38_5b TaxID=1618569 RepID=A0A0G0K7N1_9BACT|nr:MAG: UvrABC system protein B [Candidatus Woesebacteria bacterium GW2011_GWB1_38_5b]